MNGRDIPINRPIQFVDIRVLMYADRRRIAKRRRNVRLLHLAAISIPITAVLVGVLCAFLR